MHRLLDRCQTSQHNHSNTRHSYRSFPCVWRWGRYFLVHCPSSAHSSRWSVQPQQQANLQSLNLYRALLPPPNTVSSTWTPGVTCCMLHASRSILRLNLVLALLILRRGICRKLLVILFQRRKIFSRFAEFAFFHALTHVPMNEGTL